VNETEPGPFGQRYNHTEDKPLKPILTIRIMLPLLLAALGWWNTAPAQETSGAADEGEAARTQAQLTLDDLRAFTDVFNQIRRNYVGEVNDKTLLDAAIRGMLSELDPHSDYLAQPDFDELEDDSQGRYSGVGIDVEPRDRRILVRAVINGSPADQAGINPGDIITAIDGRPIKGRSLPEAMDELLGEPGTELVITVLPPDGPERELRLVREYLQIPALSYQLLPGSLGYFRISFFHRETAIHMEQALQSIGEEGTVLEGLVIDIRDNPGGVLQPAIAMADGFLDEGLIVSTRGQNEAMQLKFEAHPGQWLPDTPVIVLVNRATASASEVLAAALQDHGRALVIGERTFGKGTVQSVLPLRNGGGIKLTTALYYTPSGRSIQAEGIWPDVLLGPQDGSEPTGDSPREADLDRHLQRDADAPQVEATAAADRFRDFPVDEVLETLRAAGILGGEGHRINGDAL
jgi:carboxyl-terminal processing protease